MQARESTGSDDASMCEVYTDAQRHDWPRENRTVHMAAGRRTDISSLDDRVLRGSQFICYSD